MRPNRLSHILKSSMNTVLFVNATIGFFLKPFSSWCSAIVMHNLSLSVMPTALCYIREPFCPVIHMGQLQIVPKANSVIKCNL